MSLAQAERPAAHAVAGETPATAALVPPLSQADSLAISFGGIKAVADVSFSVAKGEIFAIVGPS